MKRYFTFTDDTSNKFWQIEIQNNIFTVTYGRIGSAGQSQMKTFADAIACQKEADKLIREKNNKGYVEERSTYNSNAPTKGIESSQNIEEVLAAFNEILKKEALNQLLPFLQSVGDQHYEVLKKYLKKKENIDEMWKVWRRTEKQKKIIALSAMAFCNEKELRDWPNVISILNELPQYPDEFSIIKWAKPKWILQYLKNNLRGQLRSMSVDYYTLRKLEDENLIEYDEEIFSKGLGGHYWGQYAWGSRKKAMIEYAVQISQDRIAVERDVHLLFKYQNNIVGAECNDTNNINLELYSRIFAK